MEDLIANTGINLIIIGDDFNGHVGEADILPGKILDGTNLSSSVSSSDTLINPRGEQVMRFMTSNGFLLLNGRTNRDRPTRPTFCSTTGKSVIDLVWVSAVGANLIKDLRTNDEVSLSDHFPVVIELWSEERSSYNCNYMTPASGSPIRRYK